MTILAVRNEDLVEEADDLGRRLDGLALHHDLGGTFVTEAYGLLREAGFLALGVPVELGGRGATPAQIAAVQRTLARHCGSTALASSMHHHVVCFSAWRYRRGLAGAEASLRRIAEEGLVVCSTGGADFTHPRGTAARVDGGFRVSGRKVFVSQSPVGDVLSTMFAFDDPEAGKRVLNLVVPMKTEGVSVVDNWDAMGMRGTGSGDVLLDHVFVPDANVIANRPYGVVDPPLQVILSIAMPIISAAYLGVADAAFAEACRAIRAAGRSDEPLVQRQIGEMANRLRVAGWALDGALAAVGDDPEPSADRVTAVMAAKREIGLAGIDVCDRSMELAGGAAFFRGSTIERCYRDIRAIKFHPFDFERTLVEAGRATLDTAGA